MKKKTYIIVILSWLMLVFTGISCSDYLNVVPDNIPTVDHAFKSRYEAEGFLHGCYSALPNFANPANNPALLGGDEVWMIDPVYALDPRLWYIARGDQGTNAPIGDWWASRQDDYYLNGGKNTFTIIRDCNIFLENIDKPFDLDDWERDIWIAEVKFLKAYYHFWLLRMYGPIPIIDENLPISSGSEEVQKYREPVDDVVAYIVELLDEAAEGLPIKIEDLASDMGRPTKAIALAVKAQVLTLAASPLFNGNPDYAGMVDNRGIDLFPAEYSQEKWEKAVVALREAIDAAHEAGHELYDFNTSQFANNLDEPIILAMQVRGAVTERWNPEIIWGDSNTNPNDVLQRQCHPIFYTEQRSGSLSKSYAPTLRTVEQFYTKNGVPIEEDKDWVGVDKYATSVAGEDHKYYISEGFETMNLHFNREARFYSSITFDGGTYFGNGKTTNDDLWVTKMKGADFGGGLNPTDRHSSTGYLCKKLVHYLTSAPQDGSSMNGYRYAFPIIRLADLYLMYAEALNEWKAAPDAEVYEYIDLVRARTGLEGVVDSWANFSTDPQKPSTKEGMRDIIRRERLNELAFEGARFWDLRRWKLAEEYMNKPIRGLNIAGEETADFYTIQDVYELSFEKKDYFWPIRQRVLLKNKNLIQNFGW